MNKARRVAIHEAGHAVWGAIIGAEKVEAVLTLEEGGAVSGCVSPPTGAYCTPAHAALFYLGGVVASIVCDDPDPFEGTGEDMDNAAATLAPHCPDPSAAIPQLIALGVSIAYQSTAFREAVEAVADALMEPPT